MVSKTSPSKRNPVYILISYAYYTKGMQEILLSMVADHEVHLLIDSGAFTAFRTGKVFTMDGYCAFLDSMAVKPERYFVLDVIGDEKKTRENYAEMLKRGYDPIPIVTYNAPASEVEYYYEHTHLIAFGGLQFLKKSQQICRIAEFEKVANGRDYHILGLTGGSLLKHFRPRSCDSSSISSANRFGSFKTYHGNGNFDGNDRKDLANSPNAAIVKACDALGMDVKDGAQEKNWRGQGGVFGLRLNVYAYMRYADDVYKALGTKMYMALCNERELSAVKYVADKKIAV